jgi:hypothetical protein
MEDARSGFFAPTFDGFVPGWWVRRERFCGIAATGPVG